MTGPLSCPDTPRNHNVEKHQEEFWTAGVARQLLCNHRASRGPRRTAQRSPSPHPAPPRTHTVASKHHRQRSQLSYGMTRLKRSRRQSSTQRRAKTPLPQHTATSTASSLKRVSGEAALYAAGSDRRPGWRPKSGGTRRLAPPPLPRGQWRRKTREATAGGTTTARIFVDDVSFSVRSAASVNELVFGGKRPCKACGILSAAASHCHFPVPLSSPPLSTRCGGKLA
jgi:hypothetical protein